MRTPSALLRAPVVRGALRGWWWLPAGGGKILRVLGGTYEAEQTSRFVRQVAPGDVVLDLGAHIGYYTLLASRLVGPGGRVFAFEPHPRNAAYLKRHVEINRCSNVEVIERAVDDHAGTVRFGLGSGTGTGRVADTGEISVATVRVDEFVAEREISPTVVKVDVEGAEARVLGGAMAMLRRDRPLIFLSTHGAEQAASCRDVLTRVGYRMTTVGAPGHDDEHVCTPEEREAQPEGASGRARVS